MPKDSDARVWKVIATAVLKSSLQLHRGQSVLIDVSSDRLKPADALSRAARGLGVSPTVLYTLEPPVDMLRKAKPSDATAIAPGEFAALAKSNGYVLIPPSLETYERRDKSPRDARRAFERSQDDWMRAIERRSIPSVLLLAASVTESTARHFGVDFHRWLRETVRGSAVNPRVLTAIGTPAARRLQRGRRLTITHPNGTHLELGLRRRRPVIVDGRVDARDLAEGRVWTTLPSGQLNVALDETVGEGQLISNRPSRHRRWAARGLKWVFRDGRLISHEARHGRRQFEVGYRAAGPERTRPGVFTIGLNPEVEDFPMWEDLEKGVVTLYIGYNDDFGGQTPGSFREYALLRGADVLVDGEPILRRGRLLTTN